MWRFRQILLSALVAIIACASVTQARFTDEQPSIEFRLPLEDGRLNLGHIVQRTQRELGRELGLERGECTQQLDWSVDVRSLLGRLQLNLFDRLAGGVIQTRIGQDEIVVTLNRDQLARKLSETGGSIDEWIGSFTGRARQRQQRTFGVTFVTAENEQAPLTKLTSTPKHIVLLVHGLDDPGFMWRDLIPQLRIAGCQVARFEYPNDGPISEGADLLASSLEGLKSAGVERVDVVAHSMGGLVTRDVLTRQAYYAGDGSAADDKRYPAIDRLIMLGTPNHGSKWARLRTLSELREHFYRAWEGETGWFSGFDADGAGEAGVDLLPESDFLRRLNDRPLATHTRFTIIAGQCGTELAQDAMRITEKARKLAEEPHTPGWLRDLLSQENQEKATTMLGETVNGLGDGCVSIESARLEDVDDFNVVAGNHLSMIVRIGPAKSEDRVPPAIPIVLDRLKKNN